MDYEKQYKEALERAKKYKEYDFRLMNAALDDIFPELKESEEKLKEFSVEEYYKNPERKVVTRDGREVEILKIDTKTKTNVPVIAMMDGNDIRFFTTNGRLSLERETCSDLFFADVDCDTCTNDKGCVTCENGELYEGKPTDCTKSNEEQAKKIAVKWKAKGLPYNAIYDSCLEMAEWKDEQFKAEKKELKGE